MATKPDQNQLARAVLTPELTAELGVVRDPARDDDRHLRFRLDPGNLFERDGQIRVNPDGTYTVRVTQRYRPHEPVMWVASATAILADVPGVLRAAARYAHDRDEQLPHWLVSRRRETPPWSWSCGDADPAVARDAIAACAAKARRTGTVMYLSTEPGRITCANNPPEDGPFFSVTSAGNWSVHWRERSKPLAGRPKPSALVDPGIPAAPQVARKGRPSASTTVSPQAARGTRAGSRDATARPRRAGRRS